MDQFPEGLAEVLAAAHAARTDIHFDLCTVYTAEPGFGCSCGIPRLFDDLVRALGIEEMASLLAEQPPEPVVTLGRGRGEATSVHVAAASPEAANTAFRGAIDGLRSLVLDT